jgi:hypothetical protein
LSIGAQNCTPNNTSAVCLNIRLFTPPTFEEKPARPLPDWTAVHRELKRRGVTLLLLWEEYRAEHARRLWLHPVLRSLPEMV